MKMKIVSLNEFKKQKNQNKHKTDAERRIEELEEEVQELKESLATLNSRVFRLLQVLQNQDDHGP